MAEPQPLVPVPNGAAAAGGGGGDEQAVIVVVPLRQRLMPLVSVPAQFLWYGPQEHYHFHGGVHVDEIARRQRNQVRSRRAAVRFTRNCSLCTQPIQIDLLRYLPSSAEYRICRIGCQNPAACHKECMQNYLIGFGEEVYTERCEVADCDPITYTARNGMTPKEWPNTILRAFYHLLVRHIVNGAICLVPLWILAYMVGQVRCLSEGHLCSSEEMGLPLASHVRGLIEVEHLDGYRMHSAVFFAGVFWVMGIALFFGKELLKLLLVGLAMLGIRVSRRAWYSMFYRFK